MDQDKTDPTLNITPVGDALAEPESSLARSSGEKRAFVSGGEHTHHWGSYLTIDWLYNATVGAVFAYWGSFTATGQKIWSKPVNKVFDTALKPFLKNPAHLKEGIKQGNTFMSIIAGGMLTIPPLLVLEYTPIKLAFVKFLDRIYYGRNKVENDPKFKQAYDEIEHAPKKDFSTGMTSRFAALAPLLLSVLVPQSKDWLVKNVFSHVGAASKTTLAKVGLPATKLFKKFSPAEQAKRWNYIHDDAIAMDLSFGLPYAVLHSFFYNMFADRKEKSKKDKDGAQAQPEAPALAAQNSPGLILAAENSKKEKKTTSYSEKHKPGARLTDTDKAAYGFLDRVEDKGLGERQLV